MFKKSHVLGALGFFLSLLILNFSPSIVHTLQAASDDFQSYRPTGANYDLYRVLKDGSVNISSGIASSHRMYMNHETFIDPAAVSTTSYRAQSFISTTSLMNSTTFFADRDVTQPGHARVLQIVPKFSSGVVVIIGTNSFGNVVQENITIASGSTVLTNWAYLYVSSFTYYCSSVSVNESSATLSVGISSGIGLMHPVDFSTDVIKYNEAGVDRSTFSTTFNPTFSTFKAANTNGATDYEVIYAIRRSLLVAPRDTRLP